MMPSDKKDCTRGGSVEDEVGERGEIKRRLRALHELCRADRRKVPESVSEAVGLAVELVGSVVVASSLGAGSIYDLCSDNLTGQLASTRAEVFSLETNVSNLEGARDKVEQEHEGVVRKMLIATRTLEDPIRAELDGALSGYRGVLCSIRGIIKATDKLDASDIFTLIQLRLFFNEGRKVKVAALSSGPFQQGF